LIANRIAITRKPTGIAIWITHIGTPPVSVRVECRSARIRLTLP